MPAVGYEPAIPASERLQTHTLNRATTGIGQLKFYDPEKANEVKMKGKGPLYSRPHLSKSYLYW
jgi:hypothetical protein